MAWMAGSRGLYAVLRGCHFLSPSKVSQRTSATRELIGKLGTNPHELGAVFERVQEEHNLLVGQRSDFIALEVVAGNKVADRNNVRGRATATGPVILRKGTESLDHPLERQPMKLVPRPLHFRPVAENRRE